MNLKNTEAVFPLIFVGRWNGLFDSTTVPDIGTIGGHYVPKDSNFETPPVLLPGESNSITIRASGNAMYLSAAAMLGATNDAFYAVRGLLLPKGVGEITHAYANAYDAGSELNEESADTVGALGATDDNPTTGDGIKITARTTSTFMPAFTA
jgi:hypothetical protein